jgi:hypothetical protein
VAWSIRLNLSLDGDKNSDLLRKIAGEGENLFEKTGSNTALYEYNGSPDSCKEKLGNMLDRLCEAEVKEGGKLDHLWLHIATAKDPGKAEEESHNNEETSP